MGRSNYGIGRILIKTGKPEEAISYMNVSRELFKSSGNTKEEMKVLLGVASAHYSLGENRTSLLLLRECYEIAYRVGNRWLQGYAMLNSTDNHVDLGDLDNALEAVNSGIEIFRKIGNEPMMFSGYVKKGRIYSKQLDWEGLSQTLDSTVLLYDKVPLSLAHCNYHLLKSQVLEVDGDYVSAITELETSKEKTETLGTQVFDDYIATETQRLKGKN